ncbi:hypothetical protein WJX73_007489 [Symbiochloris irregularis]|uniref:Oxidation resistance protein 1 n=1 Tax=Symbiochloris irregularis TaxID=706552 RepID=A0AAW1P8D1_9CHLO
MQSLEAPLVALALRKLDKKLSGGSRPGKAVTSAPQQQKTFEERFSDRFDRTSEASPSGTDAPFKEPDIPALVSPEPLLPGTHNVRLSEPSALASDSACRALAAAFPTRHRWRQWVLLYSSGRDGISLQTLYRRAEHNLPSVLLVRDHAQSVFGCFAAEGWKVAPRYYGNGESFVFQIQPDSGLWRWHQRRMDVCRNDFFQFGRVDRLAMGGGPRYAISLDGDLLRGTSGECETFGSPCLACSEEFEIGRVELWGLV